MEKHLKDKNALREMGQIVLTQAVLPTSKTSQAR